MKYIGRERQRGISLIGLIVVAGLVGFLAVVAAKVSPTFVEFQAVKKAAERARVGNTVGEVRVLFDKSAAVDDITSIAGKDLQITKNGDKVVINYSYNKEIELFGPAYLLIKYTGSTQ